MGIKDSAYKLIQEIIGRHVSPIISKMLFMFTPNVTDYTRPDYSFWDLLRRGKKSGYFLSSLYLKRIERIFSAWVFGSGFEITTGNDYTDGELSKFLRDISTSDLNSALLVTVFEDSLGLGDQFVIINADLSLSVPSPNTVTINFNRYEDKLWDSVEIKTRIDGKEIIDTYYNDHRTYQIKYNNEILESRTYDNLLGYIPIIHVTYSKGTNERFGHPIHEPLLPLLDLVNDVLMKQVDGVRLLGNPILALLGLKNLRKVMDANKPLSVEKYQDEDGNELTRPRFKIDKDTVLLLGEGGDAKFLAPPVGFTRDTRNALDTLFLMLIYNIGIPAFVWGAELNSARAASETQMIQWVHDVQAMQANASIWLIRLCEVWLQYKKLSDKKIDSTSQLIINWKPMTPVDKNILLKFLQLGIDKGVLDEESLLKLMQLVHNPKEVLAKARLEGKKKATERMQLDQSDPGVKKAGSSSDVGTVKSE